jgi:hypothetical protein
MKMNANTNVDVLAISAKTGGAVGFGQMFDKMPGA